MCLTVWRLSTKKGRQKQGQRPARQSAAETVQARRPGLEEVLVVISFWQPGHWSLAGRGPSSGTSTLTTCTTVTGPPGPFLPAPAATLASYDGGRSCSAATLLLDLLAMATGADVNRLEILRCSKHDLDGVLF